MKKLMHILFLSCFKATELIEKKFHVRLSVKERLQLRMHKMMCSACTRYEKQSAILDKGIAIDSTKEYSPEEIQKLKLKITEKLSEKS
ncbi:MAG: hypothetical protein RQ743_11250 [Bacteroidales bacterium]|nr:hypothetical protein [Bacteroidales bacterium]